MGSCESSTMQSTSVVVILGLTFFGLVLGRPQGLSCPNGDPFYENAGTVDENGCTVGYCSKVCPTGAFTNDDRFVSFKGNRGATGTGSNGNAGPINQETGVAVDPAAVSLLKQQQDYIKWAEQQVANAAKQVNGQK